MCDQCKDQGWLRVDKPVMPNEKFHSELVRCQCKQTEDAERLQRLSGLTDSERRITLDDIEVEDRPGTGRMVEACRSFISHPFGMVTFWGDSGNAKTMVLQAVINALLAVGREAVYVTAFDLISYIRSAFNKEREVIDDNAYSRLLRFEHVPILAIDEFDKVRVTEWVREQLTDLIDRRYRLALDQQTGTLLAMNDDPRDLPAWMYSRLAQNLILHNPDNDMRPLIGEELWNVQH